MAGSQDTAADGGGGATPGLTDLPQEVYDQIGRYVGLPDRGKLRLLSRMIGARFSGGVFRAVRFHDVPQRVFQQLQLFCDVTDDEQRHPPQHRIGLAELMNSVRIITIQPTQHCGGPNTHRRTWIDALNEPREYLSLDPAVPSILCRSISLMSNCTHLELDLHHLDSDTVSTLYTDLHETASSWDQVKSLRVSAKRELEEVIVERMVPKLESLQFSDFFQGGYTNGQGGTERDGSLLRCAETHPDLQRLHITIRRGRRLRFELFPPMHLFKRLVISFPELQWLGVSVMEQNNAARFTGNPDEFLVRHATDLGTVLAGLHQLKRLAVTVHHNDMNCVSGPFLGSDDPPWGLLFNTLSSKLSENHEVKLAIVSSWPLIYLRHWDMSKAKFRVAYHPAGETKGWPVSLRDEDEDDAIQSDVASKYETYLNDGEDGGDDDGEGDDEDN